MSGEDLCEQTQSGHWSVTTCEELFRQELETEQVRNTPGYFCENWKPPQQSFNLSPKCVMKQNLLACLRTSASDYCLNFT